MMFANALVTLLEAFFNIFLPTPTHTDMKALLYPCCACAGGVINSVIGYDQNPNLQTSEHHSMITIWTI